MTRIVRIVFFVTRRQAIGHRQIRPVDPFPGRPGDGEPDASTRPSHERGAERLDLCDHLMAHVRVRARSLVTIGHLIVGMAVQLTPGLLLVDTAPLLEEERNSSGLTLLPD